MTVAASNALHYPFLTVFNQARTQRVRELNAQRQKRPVTGGNGIAFAATGAASAAGVAGDAAPSLSKGVLERGLDCNGEYEFNEGEQLMLQVRAPHVLCASCLFDSLDAARPSL